MPYIQPAARGAPLGGVHRDQRHHGIASARAAPARPRELPGLAAETPQQQAGRFERDVFRYRAQLYSVALRLTRNGADADDLVQETFTRAYAGFGPVPTWHQCESPALPAKRIFGRWRYV